MLIKEYRIPLPLTVAEYRIAQLYMIQKKSRQETSGTESGVEIITNEPYENGPGGNGQYTYKVFHIGSHLPAWFRHILPKSALQVDEEAWNAYPYTRTRYTCPFVSNLVLDIETRYYDDSGSRENVFELTGTELRDRIIDLIDIVNDSVSDYHKDEDPTLYKSGKTSRGPLKPTWIQDCEDNKKPIMCAYKLCKVEFRYWGLQTKIENFIHDIALRRTMLRAHRQAWAWQDEWFGLTIEDIRQLEKEAQKDLSKKMADARKETTAESQPETSAVQDGLSVGGREKSPENPPKILTEPVRSRSGTLNSPSRQGSFRSIRTLVPPDSRDHLSAIRNDSDSEEEFFDAADVPIDSDIQPAGPPMIVRWSSVDVLDEAATPSPTTKESDQTCPYELLLLVFHGGSFYEVNGGDHQQYHSKYADLVTFRTTIDAVLKSHYPSLQGRIATRLVPCQTVNEEVLSTLASLSPYGSQHSDGESAVGLESVSPALLPLFSVASANYDDCVQVAIERANQVFYEFLSSDDGIGFDGDVVIVADMAGGLLAYDALMHHRVGLSRNPSSASGYSDLTDISVSTIPEDDVLEGKNVSNENRKSADSANEVRLRHHGPTVAARSLSVAEEEKQAKMKFLFKPYEMFLLGSPVALVLAHRHMISRSKNSFESHRRPPVAQVYNMFYAIDPCCSRLESLLFPKFSSIPPVTVPRYQRFPLGNGQSLHLLETIERHSAEFLNGKGSGQKGENGDLGNYATVTGGEKSRSTQKSPMARRSSCSNIEVDYGESCSSVAMVANFAQITSKWWGSKRVDYSLYCPEGLSSFPVTALPNLLHSSYWESKDVVAFIVRQYMTGCDTGEREATVFSPTQPTEKWKRRQTSIKIKNAAANHRGNDLLVTENSDQILTARFMYGPLDVVTLSGEKVDVYIMSKPDLGDWVFYGEELTDNHGRLSYKIPESKRLPFGFYPVKMVVKGDHTYLDMVMAVVPPQTECVVFSIDGSFMASVSVTGKDPKVRPGSVDVVRHWQELGYLILYITARPDMQQRQVLSWFARHNFPHGLVFFSDGISTDPLRQKTQYLKRLLAETEVRFHCAYGSSKDIAVYREANLTAEQIFVVGRPTKKNLASAQVLTEGYAAHLTNLATGSLALSRPAQGNGRMCIRRGYFSLQGQLRRSGMAVQRSHSFTPRSGKYETKSLTPEAGLNKPRGKSPFKLVKTLMR